MLEIKNISKSYGERSIIKDFNISLPNKGMVLLHGENGSGKTTLLKIISNNIKYEGEVVLPEGIKPTDIYYLASEEHLYDYLRVKEKARLLLNDDELNVFNEYINKYDLEYILNSTVGKLSSGERQKLELIIALSRRAPITLLDEPLEYVDKESKPLFTEEIIKLSKDSLVIESSPKDYHEADYILEFEMNKIDVVCKNELEDVKVLPGVNHKINFRDYFKALFRRNGLLSLGFNVVMMALICLFTASVLLFNTTKLSQVRSVVDKYDTGIYYSASEEKNGTRVIPNYFDDEEKNPMLEIGERKMVPHFVDGVEVGEVLAFFKCYVPKRLVETEYLYVNGEKIKINDGEVYIPDYGFDLTFAVERMEGIAPLNPKDYSEDQIASSYSGDNKGLGLTIRSYKTDYKDYIPTADKELDELKYIDQMNLFKERLNKYYSLALMNQTTLMYFIDNFRGLPKALLDDLILNNDNLEEDRLGDTINILAFKHNDIVVNYGICRDEAWNINNNEFYCSMGFAKKYLGLTLGQYFALSNNPEPSYFDFCIAGIEFKHMKFKPFLTTQMLPYPAVYLNYDDINKIYTEAKLDSIDGYDLKPSDIHMLDNNYEELLVDGNSFMYMEKYLELVSNKSFVDNTFKNGIITASALIASIILLYLLFTFKNERAHYRALMNKGYTGSMVLEASYLMRLIIFAIFIIIGAVVACSIYPMLAVIFNILPL